MKLVTVLLLATTQILSPGDSGDKKSENKLPENTLKQNNMNNQDYTATILVDATPEKAYNAIKDFRSWWSEEIEGPTDKLNEVFFITTRTFICVK